MSSIAGVIARNMAVRDRQAALALVARVALLLELGPGLGRQVERRVEEEAHHQADGAAVRGIERQRRRRLAQRPLARALDVDTAGAGSRALGRAEQLLGAIGVALGHGAALLQIAVAVEEALDRLVQLARRGEAIRRLARGGADADRLELRRDGAIGRAHGGARVGALERGRDDGVEPSPWRPTRGSRVRSSKRIAPSANTSVRSSSASISPRICSGAM